MAKEGRTKLSRPMSHEMSDQSTVDSSSATPITGLVPPVLILMSFGLVADEETSLKLPRSAVMQLIRKSALKTSRIDKFENHVLLVFAFTKTTPLRGWLRQNNLKGPRKRFGHGTRRTGAARKSSQREERSRFSATPESPKFQTRPSIYAAR